MEQLLDLAAWGVGLTLLALAALLGLATVAQVVAYRARLGWERAGRQLARVKAVPRPAAGRLGGLCVVGHWIAAGDHRCGLGHAYSPDKTGAAGRPDLRAAFEAHRRGEYRTVPLVDTAALTAELDAQRMAAGGW